MASTPIGKKLIWRSSELITSTYQAAVANIAETSLSGRTGTEREISNIPELDRIETQKAHSHKIQNVGLSLITDQPNDSCPVACKKTMAKSVPKKQDALWHKSLHG